MNTRSLLLAFPQCKPPPAFAGVTWPGLAASLAISCPKVKGGRKFARPEANCVCLQFAQGLQPLTGHPLKKLPTVGGLAAVCQSANMARAELLFAVAVVGGAQ